MKVKIIFNYGPAKSLASPIRRGRVTGVLGVHSTGTALRRALLEEAPPTRAASASQDAFENAYLAAYAELVRAGRPRRSRTQLGAAARVLAAALEGAVHDAARAGAGAAPGLRGELIRLVLGFLNGD